MCFGVLQCVALQKERERSVVPEDGEGPLDACLIYVHYVAQKSPWTSGKFAGNDLLNMTSKMYIYRYMDIYIYDLRSSGILCVDAVLYERMPFLDKSGSAKEFSNKFLICRK